MPLRPIAKVATALGDGIGLPLAVEEFRGYLGHGAKDPTRDRPSTGVGSGRLVPKLYLSKLVF